jgi:competence protein ComEC
MSQPEEQVNQHIYHFRYRLFLTVISVCTLALVVFAWLTIGQSSQPRVEVDLININHGDSILIRSSKGDTVLIDAGYPDSGTLDYLEEHNIKHINTMIATHAHEDHIGGLPEVMRAIPVDKLIYNGHDINSTYYANFQNTANELGLRKIIVKSGNRIPFGELTFKVLSPAKIRPDYVNINSIVLQLKVGNITFLFTGDTEKLEEKRLIDSGIPLHADILKVAHHAGNTSSDPAFLAKVNPTVAIYSASNNFPGFPNQDTIDNLLLSGARVYGTNFNGTITVNTDGKTYSIHTEYGSPILP